MNPVNVKKAAGAVRVVNAPVKTANAAVAGVELAAVRLKVADAARAANAHALSANAVTQNRKNRPFKHGSGIGT